MSLCVTSTDQGSSDQIDCLLLLLLVTLAQSICNNCIGEFEGESLAAPVSARHPNKFHKQVILECSSPSLSAQ